MVKSKTESLPKGEKQIKSAIRVLNPRTLNKKLMTQGCTVMTKKQNSLLHTQMNSFTDTFT